MLYESGRHILSKIIDRKHFLNQHFRKVVFFEARNHGNVRAPCGRQLPAFFYWVLFRVGCASFVTFYASIANHCGAARKTRIYKLDFFVLRNVIVAFVTKILMTKSLMHNNFKYLAKTRLWKK